MRRRSIILAASALLFASCGKRLDDPEWLLAHGTQIEKRMFLLQTERSTSPARAEKIAYFLADEELVVVGQAALSLGKIHAREYIPQLVALLTNDDPQIASLAAVGLNEMVDERDEALLPKLYPLLEHKLMLVRISAIQCLGSIGSRDSTDRLLNRLAVEEPGALWYVITALGKIQDPMALPALEARLVEVKAMDHSVPMLGGTRGSVPHPAVLQGALEEAIALTAARSSSH